MSSEEKGYLDLSAQSPAASAHLVQLQCNSQFNPIFQPGAIGGMIRS
jgi:hypothetical protein